MNLTVLTPEQTIFDGSITSVKVPGIGGQFEVLKNHAPLVSALDKGEVRIKTAEGKVEQFAIVGGFIEVLKNEVSLLVQRLIVEEA